MTSRAVWVAIAVLVAVAIVAAIALYSGVRRRWDRGRLLATGCRFRRPHKEQGEQEPRANAQ